MVLDHRGAYLDEIRRELATGFYPVQQAVDAPSGAVRWLQENLATRERLLAENAALRRATLVNTATLQKYAALQAENERLRALLGSQARVPDKVVIGEVVSVDMDPLRHRILINKGRRTGARDGQALLDAFGVVGQITRTAAASAEALLITDPDHAVPVEVVRNGLRTIAVGTGRRDSLSLPYLTRNQDVQAGDLLVTSGLGGAFPAGYPVGTVTVVDDSGGDAFREIAARPAASLDRLHEVLLVLPGTASVAGDAELTAPPGLAEPPVRPASAAAPAATSPARGPGGGSGSGPAGRAGGGSAASTPARRAPPTTTSVPIEAAPASPPATSPADAPVEVPAAAPAEPGE